LTKKELYKEKTKSSVAGAGGISFNFSQSKGRLNCLSPVSFSFSPIKPKQWNGG